MRQRPSAAPLLIVCGSTASAARPTAAAPGDAPAANLTGEPARGRQAFAETCAACHGSDARGRPHLGKDLTASEFAIGLSDAELIEFIKAGRPAGDPLNTTGVPMPPRGGNPSLTDQDLADIVAYLCTLES